MTEFWKAAGLILLTVVLGTTISKTEKDIFLVLNMMACCAIVMTALKYLSPTVDLLWSLGSHTDSDSSFIGTLLKIIAVSLITELTTMISADAGNNSLGKAMQLLGNSTILYLATPLFETFLTLIQEILNTV